MNRALYNRNVKSNAGLFLIIALIMTLYTFMTNYMYEPALAKILTDYQKTMPGVMGAFSMNKPPTNLAEFLGTYLYGFILIILPLIFSMIVANRLVVKYIDDGSMDFLISTDMSRFKIVFTQAIYMIVCLIILVVYIALVQIITSAVFFPGDLDILRFLTLNLGLLCVQIFFGGICFFASCIFSEVKHAMILGTGLPLLFVIIHMMAGSNKNLESVDKFTPLGLFKINELIAMNQDALISIAILAGVGILLYILAMIVFCRRDINV